jgi:hypothetical protein
MEGKSFFDIDNYRLYHRIKSKALLIVVKMYSYDYSNQAVIDYQRYI